MTNQKTTAGAFFLGLFGGALAAFLFSPRSGAENREQIKLKANEAKAKLETKKNKAKEAMETASLKAKVLKDEMMNGAEEVKAGMEDIKTTVKDRATTAKTAIKE